MKITLLVGLPGSGKTHLGKLLYASDNSVIYLDDITVTGGLNELQRAINVLGASNIVVSDVFLCRQKDRDKAVELLKKIAPGYSLEWVFFENTPEKCLRNAKYRNNGLETPKRVDRMIIDMSKEYTIPEGVSVREVWQPLTEI